MSYLTLFGKAFVFTIPVWLLLLIHTQYMPAQGDVARLGKISIEPGYRVQFETDFRSVKAYSELDEIDWSAKPEADVLVIGDSFAQHGGWGFQSYLAEAAESLTVLNLPLYKYGTDNPVKMLNRLLLGDVFSTLRVKYVVLECVERFFVKLSLDTNNLSAFNAADFKSKYAALPKYYHNTTDGLQVLQSAFQYSLFNFLYRFNSKAFFAQTYRLPLNKKLFSTAENELLCFFLDVENIAYNSSEPIGRCNQILNKLSSELRERNISLIVLPAPDKYDLYGKFIKANSLPANPFFKNMNKLQKNYTFIDTKQFLQPLLERGELDVYFADDTHWTPRTAKRIADTLAAIIRTDNR